MKEANTSTRDVLVFHRLLSGLRIKLKDFHVHTNSFQLYSHEVSPSYK